MAAQHGNGTSGHDALLQHSAPQHQPQQYQSFMMPSAGSGQRAPVTRSGPGLAMTPNDVLAAHQAATRPATHQGVRTPTAMRSASPNRAYRNVALYHGADAGRPATAAFMSRAAAQQAAAAQLSLGRPASSVPQFTVQHASPQSMAQHEAAMGHQFQPSGSRTVPRATSNSARSEGRAGSSPQYPSGSWVTTDAHASPTKSGGVIIRSATIGVDGTHHTQGSGTRYAWHDNNRGSGIRPHHSSDSTTLRQVPGLGGGAYHHPQGLPPQSPTRSPSGKLLGRSTSRHDHTASLLASLMVQQVSSGSPVTQPALGMRIQTLTPQHGGRAAARQQQSQRTQQAGPRAASASVRSSVAHPPRPPSRGAAAGDAAGGRDSDAGVDDASGLQRRFSTGSVMGQWGGNGDAPTPQHPPLAATARGVDVGGLASRLTEQWGTLTCVRPSTTNASSSFGLAFAAESQHEFSSQSTPFRGASEGRHLSGSATLHHTQHSGPGAQDEPVSPVVWAHKQAVAQQQAWQQQQQQLSSRRTATSVQSALDAAATAPGGRDGTGPAEKGGHANIDLPRGHDAQAGIRAPARAADMGFEATSAPSRSDRQPMPDQGALGMRGRGTQHAPDRAAAWATQEGGGHTRPSTVDGQARAEHYLTTAASKQQQGTSGDASSRPGASRMSGSGGGAGESGRRAASSVPGAAAPPTGQGSSGIAAKPPISPAAEARQTSSASHASGDQTGSRGVEHPEAKAGGADEVSGQVTAAAAAATNPLHMFGALASRRVPVYPPRLPLAVDELTLLSNHINPDHTRALPGYAVGKVIGEGGFCQVRLAVHRLSGRRVAVKVIDKGKLADAAEARRIQREIRVMRHLSHECIIKLLEVVDAPTMLYLVMEHAPSGSLLDYVRARKRLPEPDVVPILQQIVAALSYCHHREVVHRDIKLENILMDASNCMKLIDFGLSAFFIPGKQLRVHCGSPSYAAPEIVQRKHYDGPPVDVWSLGVVLFAMLAGHLPFHSSNGNKQELCAKITEGRYTCPDYVSAPAKDLLSRMLCLDPGRRITLDQVVAHPWVTGAPNGWEALGGSVYMVRVDPGAGLVHADPQLVSELEAVGYSRSTILQYLLTGEANYITAAYFLLAEGKAEVIRRMRGTQAVTRYIARSTPNALLSLTDTVPPQAPIYAVQEGGKTPAPGALSPVQHHVAVSLGLEKGGGAGALQRASIPVG